MERAEVLGRHTHESDCGIRVHIYRRDGKLIARGRIGKASFGKSLGASGKEAETNLRHMLTELDRGAFIRPSENRKSGFGHLIVPRLTFAEMCSAFIAEKRKLRGQVTAGTMLARLAPALAFAEAPNARKKWPLAQAADRDFAIALRAFLASYKVTANGRPGATPRIMSQRQKYNVLGCVRSLFGWAQSPQVRKLPSDFVNPFTVDIVGTKPKKDPLRPVLLPIERRIKMIPLMDLWELTHLGLLFVLPMRPEEACGLLISDIDWQHRQLLFQTRFHGADFTKARTSFKVPFPDAMGSLLEECVGGRTAGPLLLARKAPRRRCSMPTITSDDELERLFQEHLLKAPTNKIQSEQDTKQEFRSMLRTLGGCQPDELTKAFKPLLKASGESKGIRCYDLRGAITSDMMRAKIGHLEMRYLTGHSCSDILNEYASLDIDGQMQQYFQLIEPVLTAITNRFNELASVSETAPSVLVRAGSSD